VCGRQAGAALITDAAGLVSSIAWDVKRLPIGVVGTALGTGTHVV